MTLQDMKVGQVFKEITKDKDSLTAKWKIIRIDLDDGIIIDRMVWPESRSDDEDSNSYNAYMNNLQGLCTSGYTLVLDVDEKFEAHKKRMLAV